MSLRKKLLFTFIMLISFQCVATAFISDEQTLPLAAGIHCQHHKSPLASFLFEKTSEEEERDNFVSVELNDFSHIAVLLAQVYTPHVNITPFELRVATRPELFELHCTLLI